MARTNLGDLLGKLPPEEVAATEPPQVEPRAEPRTPAARPLSAVGRPSPRSRPAADAPEPGYLGFVRKDARLREDQLEALTVQARRLNRAKRNTGVRITENTLIRIAIDLLMDRVERASGDDEDALRRSLQ